MRALPPSLLHARLCLASLAIAFAACTPDIAEDPPPKAAIIAEFDPGAAIPVVPAPNDLAKDASTGKLKIPSNEQTPAAQRELNDDYLGGLDGFPFESTAEVLVSGALDPKTVKADTVVVLDLTNSANPVALTPRYDAEKLSISVAPPAGGWLRGHKYAIAVIGGSNGVRGANNEPVIGSPAWVLVTGKFPLFECDKDNPDHCAPTVDIIPSSKFDPVEKFKDQVDKAKKLDQLRKGYAPLLENVARARGIDKSDIPILWTFSILDAGEVTFDPANRVLPFPNDAVRTGPDGKVNLPNPKTGAPLTAEDCAKALSDPAGDQQLQLTCGLNTLDGFSTLVSPVSENAPKLGALQQGLLDAASLNPKVAGLVPVKPGVPTAARTVPKFTPCLNCVSSPDETGKPQTTPQQLQWKLDAPLDEKTTYLAYLTTDAKDDKGKNIAPSPAFALLRSKSPLLVDGKTAVSTITTEQAQQLEPLRAALAPALDALDAAGVPRSRLALAFPFTTQSEMSVLDQLRTVPDKAAATGLPAGPTFVVDATAAITAAAGAAGIPITDIGKFYAGAFLTPVLVTGPGGTLDPTKPKVMRVDFTMSVPNTPAPAGGYPTTIFGHGFTRSRNDFLAIANSLAKAGQVTIAADVIFHGDRTSCTGSKTATKQTTDDAACADPTTQKCDGTAILGLCVARNDAVRNTCAPGPSGDAFCAGVAQGKCAPDNKCQAADLKRDASGKPVISGWNMFSLTNFFATRDNFRQQVIDLSQLVRVIKSPGPTGLAGQTSTALDATRLGYVGQSMGGILGTLFNAVSPDVNNVVLNVPGGALPQIILNAPSFAEQKAALLSALGAQGIKPGTPDFDQFIGIIQWILDPADPANMGFRLTAGIDIAGTVTPNPKRKAFIQFIEGDQTVPNVSNFALVRGANRTFNNTPPSFGCAPPLYCYEFTEAGDGFDATTLPVGSRHGFLLAPTVATVKAQTQAATFLATGALP